VCSFVLIPGAGGDAWYWSRVVSLLLDAGREAIAVDLPGDDPKAGLDVYVDRVVAAIGERANVILVAQSLGGFVAPLVCARVPIRTLVFVNAMIPRPGETAGDWWGNTKSEEARVEAAERGGYTPRFDIATYFLHDLPKDVAAESGRHARPQAELVFSQPCAFERWPSIPIHVVVGNDDRFFPADFQERIAKERLGKSVDRIAGGHLVSLSNPRGVVERLSAYARQ
jgi:pimeloyl-ACP methyl ester carboxylesterase